MHLQVVQGSAWNSSPTSRVSSVSGSVQGPEKVCKVKIGNSIYVRIEQIKSRLLINSGVIVGRQKEKVGLARENKPKCHAVSEFFFDIFRIYKFGDSRLNQLTNGTTLTIRSNQVVRTKIRFSATNNRTHGLFLS